MTSGSPPTGSGAALPEPVIADLELRLRARQQRRDAVHDRARALRRRAQDAMRRQHRGEGSDTSGLDEHRDETSRFVADHAGESREEAPLAVDAFQEVAEALLLEAVVEGRTLPSPSEMGVPVEPYVLGLADLVGEIRRLVLGELSEGRLDVADARLALMEEIYHALMRLEAPRSVVALKPKQDTARALLERTRGEITMARMLRRAAPPGSREGSTA